MKDIKISCLNKIVAEKFTPEQTDAFIKEFLSGGNNIPVEFGTISRSGKRLTIGGNPEDPQAVNSQVTQPVEIVSFTPEGREKIEVVPDEYLDRRIGQLARQSRKEKPFKPRKIPVFTPVPKRA